MGAVTRRSLRVQLTIVIVVLLSLGIVILSVIATTALRGFWFDRVDEQLAGGMGPFATASVRPPPDVAVENQGPRPPSSFYLTFIYADGRAPVVLSTSASDAGPAPAVPAVSELPGLQGQPFIVGSVASGPEWRVLVKPLVGDEGWAVAAVSMADMQATMRQLILLQVLVGLAVVIIAGGVGYVIVRRSLRPLDDMADAAKQITAGDLSVRAAEDDAASAEVHELSTAFNTMVTRIEDSFAAEQESESQARASEERMRQFVADAGHELRTPLTSIRGYAELIEQGAADDPSVALARIQDEARRMGELVDDLQLLARLDEDRQLDLVDLDLGQVVGEAVASAKTVEPDREFIIDCVNEAAVVRGDSRRLRQVMDNLLSNAVRYSVREAPIAVGIDGSDHWVLIRVTDRGVGLTEDECSRVFERLYRTDDARTRVRGGSGLGLAIVLSIVEAHGGEVFVASEIGVGSTFGFTLPIEVLARV